MFLSSPRNLSPSNAPSGSANGLLDGLTLRSTQQPSPQLGLGRPPFATQSQSRPLQQYEQPRPVCTWTAHAPSSPSPFPRHFHALSATATAAGELFLFGGYADGFPSNDLYVFSTRNFSSTLWHTSGHVPSPRVGHSAVLTGTFLLIWGGCTEFSDPSNRRHDDSIHLLNLGTLDL
jgi:hypothetical protein